MKTVQTTGKLFLDTLIGKRVFINFREPWGRHDSFPTYELIGQLVWHDRWHLCIENGKQILVYKHAIQFITDSEAIPAHGKS